MEIDLVFVYVYFSELSYRLRFVYIFTKVNLVYDIEHYFV